MHLRFLLQAEQQKRQDNDLQKGTGSQGPASCLLPITRCT